MSSQENSHQNTVYGNQTWENNFSKEESMPRPPNALTESRVLSRLPKNNASPRPHSDSQQNQVVSVTQTQPHPDTNKPSIGSQTAQVTSSPKSQQPLTLPEVRNQLSAEAKEFVPRSQAALVSNSYPSQEYNQDDPSSLSVSAEEFIPRIPEEYSDYTYTNVPYEDCLEYGLEYFNSLSLHDLDSSYAYEVPSESTDNPILSRFNQALRILIMHPGNMEDYLRPICEMIQNSSDTTEIVNDIVESLFNQSLQEPNFRYTGARICQFLDKNLKSNPHFSGFNKIFVKRCQKEYNRRQELKNGSQSDQERLRGLAMLMAEIFLNIETELNDGIIQRLGFLPGILTDFVKTLLTSPSDLDVKCSCQLLKLSGGLIEDVMKNSTEDCKKFEEIFTQLQSLQTSSKLTENTKFMIGNVIKLKNSDWNRSPSSPSKNSMNLPSSEPNDFQVPEPVFYNKLGPCSRTEAGLPEEETEDGAYILNDEEEDAFLIWQAEQEGLTDDQGSLVIDDSGYDSYQIEEVVDEGGMGDEMEAAYEEFLQKQNFMQGFQPHHVGPPEQQIHTPVHQMFNHPPPNMLPRQVFNGYQQQHMLPSNQQQNMLPPNQQPNMLLSNQQQNMLPSNQQQQHMLQFNQQQNMMPLSQQQNMLPSNQQQQHMLQSNQQQNMLPSNQQQQYMLQSNQQQNQMPQQHHIQQQQQQNQQTQYPNNDRFHYRRV